MERSRLPLWTRKVYVSADKISFLADEDGAKLIYLECGQVVRCHADIFSNVNVGDFYVVTGCGEISIWAADQFRSEHARAGGQ